MTLLKVGDYLPKYLSGKLQFTIPSIVKLSNGGNVWSAGFSILYDDTYIVREITNDTYRVGYKEYDFLLKSDQVDALISQHKKANRKSKFSKLFKFLKSK